MSSIIYTAVRLDVSSYRGLKTADDRALGGDMILAAQARLLEIETRQPVVVATENSKHLDLLIAAKHWRDLTAVSLQ